MFLNFGAKGMFADQSPLNFMAQNHKNVLAFTTKDPGSTFPRSSNAKNKLSQTFYTGFILIQMRTKLRAIKDTATKNITFTQVQKEMFCPADPFRYTETPFSNTSTYFKLHQ